MFKDMTKTDLVKKTIHIVTAVTTYSLTRAIIQNNVSEPETKTEKVTVGVGSFVLGKMVADKASAWADDKTDKYIASWREAQAEVAAQKNQDTTES